jgi:acyl-CoA synthetase (AMP-forming)/AMP-acid ligase II
MSDDAFELLDRLRRHATDAPDRLAVREIAAAPTPHESATIAPGTTITYRELQSAVVDFAQRLGRGVPAGSVVLLRCPNTVRFHVGFLGALAAGMSVFPCPHEMTDFEIAAAVASTSVAAVIDADLNIRPLGAAPVESGRALLLQSSGTTGLPKIVRRDAASLDAVSANMVSAIGIAADDRVLSCVPLCHSYGLEHGLLAPIFAGASVHLAQGFDLATVRRELNDRAITAFPAVPSIYEMLGNLAGDGGRLPSLRVAYSAGAPLPASVFERVRDAYGIRVGQLYGATEIGSVTFSHPARDPFEPDSVGRAFGGVELRTDDNGQLLVRATSMMSGYVGIDARDGCSPLDAGGFFPTGDLVRIDASGNLFITGRLKLLIDVGGLKVNPLEVELAMGEHPSVAACVVVPMRLSETVARLKAIVTPADPGRPPQADDLRRFARQRLSAHKVPRVFEVRESLPRSATGKVLRHLLRESA